MQPRQPNRCDVEQTHLKRRRRSPRPKQKSSISIADRPKMHPTCLTWRVRVIPLDFDKRRLADVLQHHPSLQITKTAGVNEEDNDSSDNDVWVHTLAPDLRSDQVATIRFRHLPA